MSSLEIIERLEDWKLILQQKLGILFHMLSFTQMIAWHQKQRVLSFFIWNENRLEQHFGTVKPDKLDALELLQCNIDWNNQEIHYISSLVFYWSKPQFFSKKWEKNPNLCQLFLPFIILCCTSVMASKLPEPLTFITVKLIVCISGKSSPNLICQQYINYRLSIRVKWNYKKRILCSKTFCEIVILHLLKRNRTK